MDLSNYEWIVGLGAVLALTASYGIGANDVANAFATSVGSKSLSIKQAIGLAAIFEFSGALLMGSHVTDTVRKGIADYACFQDDPAVLMYGCQCVLFAVSVWLVLASSLEMPVSTTHSCVGGMIGMTMAARGASCVKWSAPSDDFPFVGGVSAIVISWVLSPVFSAVFASLMFYVMRMAVLRRDDSFKRVRWAFPIIFGMAVCINVFFIIYKGAKFLKLDDIVLWKALAIAFGSGGGVGILSYFATPYIMRKSEEIYNDSLKIHELGDTSEITEMEEPVIEYSKMSWYKRIVHYLKYSLNVQSADIVNQDEDVQHIHNNAEVFDEKTEISMRYMQVLTACCDAFAHGANDVANSIAPFGAIWAIYKSGEVSSKKNDLGNDAYWILSMGAFGIVLGLATYGYKILHALGTKLSKITPSRGVCIELGSACIVILGSRLGWPLSTTHCQVGATTGVALLEGTGGVNKKILAKTVAGWIMTLVVVGGTTALIFAQGAYSPMAYYPDYIKNKTL